MSLPPAPPTLEVRLTKLSSDKHRFEYRRPDGSGEALDLETSSFLVHDLLHFAVESQAGLQGSFYGLLAKVGGYGELSVAGGAALGGEVAITERVVGALAGALNEDVLEPGAFVEQVSEYLEAYDERAPAWFTPEFVLAVRQRMRELTGRWRSTAFGEAMELSFALAR